MSSISMRLAVDGLASGSVHRFDTLKVRSQEGSSAGFSWLRAIGSGLLLSYVVICSFAIGYTHLGPAVKMFLQ